MPILCADLAREVSAGRRQARDIRDLALDIIEPSAFAMRAVNGSGLGASGHQSGASLWRVVGQASIGQSLSTAFDAATCLSTTQPYSNVYVCDSSTNYNWDGGPTSGVQFSWVPFACGVTCGSSPGIRNNASAAFYPQYPDNITPNGELNTIAASSTRTNLALSEGYSRYIIASSDVGEPGVGIDYLIKGSGQGNAYAAMVFEAAVNTALTAITISSATVGSPTVITASAAHHLLTGNKVYITGATGMTELNGYFAATVSDGTHFSVPVASTHPYTGSGKATSYGLRSAYFTHGETDATFGSTIAAYLSASTGLLQIINNAQTDIAAVTGQTESINWYLSQQNADIIGYGGSAATSTMVDGNSTAQALYTLITTPHVFISGPKYQFDYCSNCGPHISNIGQRAYGEKEGEVTDIAERTGSFLPLYATTASVSVGTTVVFTYHVPVGCLSFSGTLTPSHQSGVLSNVWMNGKGYEPYDDTGLTITGTTGNGVSPIEYTVGSSLTGKIATNDYVCVGGEGVILTNKAANTCAQATVNDSTHFSLAGTTGNGAYGGLFGSVKVLDLLPVTSATVTACNQTTVILGRAAATTLKFAYANAPDTYFGSIASGQAGCGNGGSCGLLQDGDTFVAAYPGASGTPLPNYGVTFQDKAVPFSVAGGTRGSSALLGLLALVPLALRRRRADNDAERIAA